MKGRRQLLVPVFVLLLQHATLGAETPPEIEGKVITAGRRPKPVPMAVIQIEDQNGKLAPITRVSRDDGEYQVSFDCDDDVSFIQSTIAIGYTTKETMGTAVRGQVTSVIVELSVDAGYGPLLTAAMKIAKSRDYAHADTPISELLENYRAVSTLQYQMSMIRQAEAEKNASVLCDEYRCLGVEQLDRRLSQQKRSIGDALRMAVDSSLRPTEKAVEKCKAESPWRDFERGTELLEEKIDHGLRPGDGGERHREGARSNRHENGRQPAKKEGLPRAERREHSNRRPEAGLTEEHERTKRKIKDELARRERESRQAASKAPHDPTNRVIESASSDDEGRNSRVREAQARKPAIKKSTVTKPAARGPAAKKAAPKKPAAKKPAAKKPAAKKAAPRRPGGPRDGDVEMPAAVLSETAKTSGEIADLKLRVYSQVLRQSEDVSLEDEEDLRNVLRMLGAAEEILGEISHQDKRFHKSVMINQRRARRDAEEKKKASAEKNRR